MRKAIKDNEKESRREWLLWMFERAGKKNKRNNGFQLWLQHNHPIELSSNEMMDQRLDYLHNNPLGAGFVDDPAAWVWSSCAQYHRNEKGMVDIYYLE